MQVPIVGHSQGGTIALAALSRLDKMNDAVSLLVAVAPVVRILLLKVTSLHRGVFSAPDQ